MVGGNFMNILRLNGVYVKSPSEYEVTLSDLDGSGTTRSISGQLHRERIRSAITKLNLYWNSISYSDVSSIIDATSSEKFQVDYFFGDDTLKTAYMYAGDRSLKLVATNGKNMSDTRWDLSLNLIEY